MKNQSNIINAKPDISITFPYLQLKFRILAFPRKLLWFEHVKKNLLKYPDI